MTRLIDADGLPKEISWDKIENASFWETINEQPTIDAVQVIRCKDCKFSILNNGVYVGSVTHGTCIAMGATVDGDDYCSWAERRGEE